MTQPILAALLLTLLPSLALAQEAAFSIKGLQLGMTRAQVDELLAPERCLDLKPGLVRCIKKQATIVEVPAKAIVEILDDAVVRIDYEGIAFPASSAVSAGFTAKYGQPDESSKVKAGDSLFTIGKMTDEMKWRRGPVVLSYTYDEKSPATQPKFDAGLIDSLRYDQEWTPRLEGKFKAGASQDL